jgi:hypothetical protein
LSKFQQIFQSILDQEASNNTLQRTCSSAKINSDRRNVARIVVLVSIEIRTLCLNAFSLWDGTAESLNDWCTENQLSPPMHRLIRKKYQVI